MVTDEASPQPTAPESGPDQKAAAAPDTTTGTAPLGLALSGGGVRAALFSLGVVIGLIETECHRRVRCLSSVSGGSILNAALAHEKSLASFSSLTEFEPLASKLAASLASQGIFAFDWRTVFSFVWNLIAKALPTVLPVAAGLIAVWLQSEVRWIGDIVTWIAAIVSEAPWLIAGSIGVGLLLLVIYYRGVLQEARFASVLGEFAGLGQRLYVRDWGATSGEQGPGVMYVLVATDLLSGEPIYFSGKFVHCKQYGWSTPEQINTEEAFYRSDTITMVFAPQNSKKYNNITPSCDNPVPWPRLLRLAYVCVYNNLGNYWFEILKKQSQASPPSLCPFGELSVEPSMIETKNVIIVNAGARSRRLQRL